MTNVRMTPVSWVAVLIKTPFSRLDNGERKTIIALNRRHGTGCLSRRDKTLFSLLGRNHSISAPQSFRAGYIPQTARFWNLNSLSILNVRMTSESISRGTCLLGYAVNTPNKVNLYGKWKRKSVKMIWVDSSQLRDLTTMGRSHPWPRTWSGVKCVG